jgi:hypothetical protein
MEFKSQKYYKIIIEMTIFWERMLLLTIKSKVLLDKFRRTRRSRGTVINMFNNICDIKGMNRRPKNVGQSTVCPGSEQ